MNQFYQAILDQLFTPLPAHYYIKIIFLMWVVVSIFNWVLQKNYTSNISIWESAKEAGAKHNPYPELRVACAKCYTFWIILAITWNPFTAAICSAGVLTFQSIINTLNTKIKL